jgi:3-hydroxy-9,10-secoandrosta-1,3,5(10)-triene-9,17-dione monooxygenase
MATKQQVLERVRTLVPGFRDRAETAEEARRIPDASVREMLDAGIARILIPERFGGYGLGFDTWFDVMQEISRADASHGWCASLIIHHPHFVAQCTEQAQKDVWAGGPDVPIAASFLPIARIVPADGGYRVTGRSPFASGVGHCTWVFVGGMIPPGLPALLLVPPGDYTVDDVWFTTGMRGTGSNTIVTNNVFVPESRVLRLPDLIDGNGPGGKLHANPIYRTGLISYAPLAFAAPMLGAAQGAYEHFREWTRTREGSRGGSIAEITSIQVRLARAAANLDAAEMLLRRASDVSEAPTAPGVELRARSMRDYARASELIVEAIDALIEMSGTAGFASSSVIQRAWRDIHFASMHISLNTENNFAHFGRLELGLPRDSKLPFY